MSPGHRRELLCAALDDAAVDAPRCYQPTPAGTWDTAACAAYLVFYDLAHAAWSAAAETRRSRAWTEIGRLAVAQGRKSA